MDTAAVIIDDDDEEVVSDDGISNNHDKNTDKTEISSNTSTFVDVIDLDEESAPENDITNNNIFHNVSEKCENGDIFVMLLKSNAMMNKIIQRCLKMADNVGMPSVINRTLIPLYKNADNNFKKSESFLKFLSKTLHNIKHDPSHKFSHIKSLCEQLKQGKDKKKVPFVTLSTDLKKSNPQRQPEQHEAENNNIVKKNGVIDLDNSDDDKIITLNDDDSDIENDVMFVDETKNGDELKQSNKGNCYKDNDNNKVSHLDSDLLVPTNSVTVTNHSSDYQKAMNIEKQIAYLKTKIDELEEKEVTNDSSTSPYLLSDKYKAKIVTLYKKLCQLTGNGDGNLMKQCVVRLQVINGHPLGPVRRLEHFLNSNIDETGSVPLPDLHDVVRIVTQSNIVDRLGWTKQEIMQEALVLFTQCGHALRKSRQKREYKDLMRFAQDKMNDDDDPANQDPELFARLEENKLIAKANEDEIIDRYVKLANTSTTSTYNNNIKVKYFRIKPIENSDSDSENDCDRAPQKKIKIVSNQSERSLGAEAVNNTVPEFNSFGETSRNQYNQTSIKPVYRHINYKDADSAKQDFSDIRHSSERRISMNIEPGFDNLQSVSQPYITVLHSNMSTQNIVNRNIEELQWVSQPSVTIFHSQNIEARNMVNLQGTGYPNIAIFHSETSSNGIELRNINNLEMIGHPETTMLNSDISTENIITSIKTETSVTNTEVNEKHLDQTEVHNDLNKTQVATNNVLEGANIIESNVTSEISNVTVEEEIKVKQEAIDIQSSLNKLGNDYITTVFDIEDPFLVIDISDSSSDDEL